MSIKFIKGLPVAIMALAVSTTFADYGTCCPTEKCEAEAAMEVVPTIKPNCCLGPVLCPAYPTCIECYNVHFDIGFLYEQMRITQTDFGFASCNPPGVLPKSATILRPKFDMEWGLTVGLGYYMEHDNWYVGAKFDWLRSKGNRRFGDIWNENIEPTNIWKTNLITDPALTCFTFAERVENEFTVNYLMLQVDLNRATYLSTFMSIDPHWGLRVTWFYYHNLTEFSGGSELSNLDTNANNVVEHLQKSRFWGIGPVWGVHSKWFLCQGFTLYCDNNLGLLFGDARARDITRFSSGCGSSSDRTIAGQKLQVMSPFAQVVIGIGWERCVCDNTQAVSIKAGLDTTHYWNNWSHINVINEGLECGTTPVSIPTFHSADDAEVSMLGLRVEFGWDF